MLLLLVVTGLLYVVLGDLREAIALLATIFVVIGITLYQEHKAEHALEALRDLSSPCARNPRWYGTSYRRPRGLPVTRDQSEVDSDLTDSRPFPALLPVSLVCQRLSLGVGYFEN